jgi:cytochrome c biogenesis protein CcmG/thiol:disulfide interchange protein DsbE
VFSDDNPVDFTKSICRNRAHPQRATRRPLSVSDTRRSRLYPHGRQRSPVKLSEYKGKVVLLDFWATWCGPCKAEIPWFIEFEKTYKDRGFEILGVSMDENGWQAVRPFAKQMAIQYPVMIGNDGVAQLYGGIESLPMTFLIDRAGRIAGVHSGLVSKHDYRDEILRLIAP